MKTQRITSGSTKRQSCVAVFVLMYCVIYLVAPVEVQPLTLREQTQRQDLNNVYIFIKNTK